MNHSLQEYSKLIEKYIKSLEMAAEPKQLFEPITYTLDSGGKRIRPLIVLSAYSMFADDVVVALDVAAAVEVLHNFTLLHDDIMDKSEVRRGRPTVHTKWNDNVAILSGDAMLIYAYQLLGRVDGAKLKPMLEIFNNVAMDVCRGQQYDIDFETMPRVTVEQYMEMIKLKTSVMLGGAAQLGAIAAGADFRTAESLYRFGVSLGLAFQIQDDILDSYGDTATFGKQIGGDIAANKKTFLLIKALELTNDRATLEELIDNKTISRQEKFDAVRAIYDTAGVRQLAEQKVKQLFTDATEILAAIEVDDKRKEPLRQIVELLFKREK